MGKKVRLWIVMLLIVSMFAAVFAGCATKSPDDGKQTQEPGKTTDTPATEEPKEKITLTTLAVSNPAIDSLIGGDFNKRPWNIELEKRTGVHLE